MVTLKEKLTQASEKIIECSNNHLDNSLDKGKKALLNFQQSTQEVRNNLILDFNESKSQLLQKEKEIFDNANAQHNQKYKEIIEIISTPEFSEQISTTRQEMHLKTQETVQLALSSFTEFHKAINDIRERFGTSNDFEESYDSIYILPS
tara:strand:+ start:8299 stop:8745 length:447 start_codon:yes stop_codon:yes gene_type:complete